MGYRRRGDFKPSAEDNYIYLIQAGSFKTKAQAEKLLVELTLLGLEPKINSAKNASGNLWYRVRLGPFTTRGGMTAARSTIISNNAVCTVGSVAVIISSYTDWLANTGDEENVVCIACIAFALSVAVTKAQV